MDCSHLDATARGAFTSLNVTQAKNLIEKMVTNQAWNEEWLQPKKRGMHIVHEVDALYEKMDLLMKKLKERANFKKDWEAIQHYASARGSSSSPMLERVLPGGSSPGFFQVSSLLMAKIQRRGEDLVMPSSDFYASWDVHR